MFSLVKTCEISLSLVASTNTQDILRRRRRELI